MTRRRRSSILQVGMVPLCGLLTAASVIEHRAWKTNSLQLAELLRSASVPEEIVADAARQPNHIDARIRAARALLALELQPDPDDDTPPAERRSRALRGIPNLDRASNLALAAIGERPVSWQAHMVLGAGRFLSWSRRGDPRLTVDRMAWEGPLRRATELAAGQREPFRFLASAYLNEWSRLDDQRRSAALPILSRALRDPQTLDALAVPWLRVAPSLETALEILPDTPQAWSRVSRVFAQRRDWERFCLALTRGERAGLRAHVEAIDLARSMAGAGDVRGARDRILSVIGTLPVRGPYERLLADALRVLPPGPLPAGSTRRLDDWLEWATQRCLEGRCRLDADVAARIAGLSRGATGHSRAEAAILAEDLPTAERLERRSMVPLSDEWSRYLLLKSDLHLRQGRRDEAHDALDLVGPEWRQRPEYAALRARAGLSSSSDPALGATAPTWTEVGGIWQADILSTTGHAALELSMSPGGTAGAAEIWWNGALLGFYPVHRSARLVVRPAEWLPLNRLEVLPLERRTTRPVAVALLPAT